MIAFIPGLCPFDDILVWVFAMIFPVVARKIYKNRKWCKKSCDCECHETGVNPKYKCPECGLDYKDHKPGLMGGIDCPVKKQ